jgi:hypothetical protein
MEASVNPFALDGPSMIFRIFRCLDGNFFFSIGPERGRWTHFSDLGAAPRVPDRRPSRGPGEHGWDPAGGGTEEEMVPLPAAVLTPALTPEGGRRGVGSRVVPICRQEDDGP